MNALVVNCILLMISATVLLKGLEFYLDNKKTSNYTRYYILFYSVFSGIWCLSYGAIGFVEPEKAELIRIAGVFALNGFIVVETFLVSGMSESTKAIVHGSRLISIVLALVDFAFFSNPKVDIFVREGNWTTWYVNPEMQLQRNIHSILVFLMFTNLMIVGFLWVRNNRFKRQRKFISLVYAANFLMLAFSLPDTFLPAFGMTAIPTSGIGSAVCTFVILFGATKLNSFDIQMGNVANNIYNFVNAGVMVFDLEYKLILANPYLQRAFSLIGVNKETLPDLFDIEDDPSSVFRRSLYDIVTLRLKAKNSDSVYSVQINCAKDDYNEPYCYIVVAVDVSEEISMVRELELANNAKNLFLTSVSHEIRTPLNAVLGFNEIIRKSTDDPEIIEYTDNISQSGSILLTLISDLLDLGKLSSGNINLILCEYYFAEIITGTQTLHQLRAKDKGLDFQLTYNESIPQQFIGDNVRLQQVITNLVSNSIKYTNEGRVELNFDYEMISDNAANLIISVSDTGIGMKQEDLPYIFDAFKRFDEQNHRHVEGIGIGLAITNTIVSLMGGKIDVTSEYGVGTRFVVTIPQHIVDPNPVGKITAADRKNEESNQIKYTAPEAVMLVVDDNELNLKAFCGILKNTKIKIDTSSSGLDAIERIKEKHYDLIFMDYMMPQLDGIETLHRIREMENHSNIETPVIIMTADAVSGARESYLREGFTDYISKPVNVAKLEKMISKYLPQELVLYETSAQGSKESVVTSEKAGDMSLPPVDGVDWRIGFTNIPDREVLVDVIKTFYQSSEDDVSFLNEKFDGIAKENGEVSLNDYRIRVHAMKHSSGVIGAQNLSDAAKELEYAARDRQYQVIVDNHEQFVNEYLRIANDIYKSFVQKQIFEEVEIGVCDRQTLLRKLDEAEEAMKSMDTLALNDICFELSKGKYETPQVEELVHRLCDAFRDFDEEGFFNTIAELKSQLE